jgi:predicted lipoprotein with Yx(FWY)xxD motif
VLVDSKGAALYTNDIDGGQKIACTATCLTEWVPLAAPAQGKTSVSDATVQSKLGTVKRPDGSSQVTFGGRPLYSFVEDTPGQVTGNGFADSFGGTNFVWTAATTGGGSAGSSPPATTTQGSSGGYGGSMY